MPRFVSTTIQDTPPNLGKDFDSTFSGTTYSYNVSQNLKLWLRLGSTLENLASSNQINSVSYINSPSTSTQNINGIPFENALFVGVDDSGGEITYDSTDNPLSFTDGSSDKPFSVSLWYKRDSAASPDNTYETLFSKGYSSTNEYSAQYDPVNRKFFFSVVSSGGTRVAQTPTLSIYDDVWYHLVFVYDATGGTNCFQLYRNGSNVSFSNNDPASYSSMQKLSNTFHVGSRGSSTLRCDGRIAEMAVWQAALTNDQARAIYYATEAANFTSSISFSGILNLPPRLILSQRDNATGSYSTVARTGDASRTGRYRTFYDDLNTVDFTSSYAKAKLTILETSRKRIQNLINRIHPKRTKLRSDKVITTEELLPKSGETFSVTDANSNTVTFTFRRDTLLLEGGQLITPADLPPGNLIQLGQIDDPFQIAKTISDLCNEVAAEQNLKITFNYAGR